MSWPGFKPELVLLDADGVLWTGEHSIDGAREFLHLLSRSGIQRALISNNSVYLHEHYLARCERMGYDLKPHELFSAGLVSAAYLEHHHGSGRILLHMSAEIAGYIEERIPGAVSIDNWLDSLGLADNHIHVQIVDALKADPFDALLVGIDRLGSYRKIGVASAALSAGAKFYCCNADYGFPTEAGTWLPDSGGIADMLARLTGVQPEILGKPSVHLLDEIEAATGVQRERMLIIGDRLETDMAMASQHGLPGILVLTGVATVDDAIRLAELEGNLIAVQDLRAAGELLGL
ncbi:MAG: HAD-IIA family hydrolase [Planctomycetales bacterium]|nr:HAD-IIA family hydrolase [bacterium]UNM08664.1 MAG: HAD-IIA family hydrolase [Planctomycetales bacterium]